MAGVGSQLGHFVVAQGIAAIAGVVYQGLDAPHTTSVRAVPKSQQLTATTVPTATGNVDSTISFGAPVPTQYRQLEDHAAYAAPSGVVCLVLTALLLLAIFCASWWLALSLQEEYDHGATERSFDEQALPQSIERERISRAREEKHASLMLKCLPLFEIIDTAEEYRDLMSARFTEVVNARDLVTEALTEASNATAAAIRNHACTRDELSSVERENAQLRKQLDEKAKNETARDVSLASANAMCNALREQKENSDNEAKRLRQESGDRKLQINDLQLRLQEAADGSQEARDAEVKRLSEKTAIEINSSKRQLKEDSKMQREMLKAKTQELDALNGQHIARLTKLKQVERECDQARRRVKEAYSAMQQAQQASSDLRLKLAASRLTTMLSRRARAKAQITIASTQKDLADMREARDEAFNSAAEQGDEHDMQVSSLETQLAHQARLAKHRLAALTLGGVFTKQTQADLRAWKFGTMWLRKTRQKQAAHSRTEYDSINEQQPDAGSEHQNGNNDEPKQGGKTREIHHDVKSESGGDGAPAAGPSCASGEPESAALSDVPMANDTGVPKLGVFTFQASNGVEPLGRGEFMTPKIKTKARTKRGGKGRSSKKNNNASHSTEEIDSHATSPAPASFVPNVTAPNFPSFAFGMTPDGAEDPNAFHHQLPRAPGRRT